LFYLFIINIFILEKENYGLFTTEKYMLSESVREKMYKSLLLKVFGKLTV